MLYIAIPAHNEGQTIGVLLWRIRKVFQGYSREYEILVYDDASTDGTTETLAPYSDVAPLTVIRGETRKGYGHALSVLAREVSRRTKYPRRDAMIVMQGDFTDQPEHLPELIKRFEGGADIVVGERTSGGEPDKIGKLRKFAPWAIRFSIGTGEFTDPFGSFKLIRISILRDLLKASPETPIVTADGWAANLQLLLATMPLARRVERVELKPRYDLRVRETRIHPFADWMSLYRFGRTMRGRQLAMPAPAEQPSAPRAAKPRERATS
ncbi:MAG TPA: glycosyltransferase family 2 protein [Gemmatimonadaceae bacterium]|nr:glycosyltransferase family 2 protein [Gemmatimonadaceae bacterium]